jgi:hypothetical protein
MKKFDRENTLQNYKTIFSPSFECSMESIVQGGLFGYAYDKYINRGMNNE